MLLPLSTEGIPILQCNVKEPPHFHISLTRPSYTTTGLLILALSTCFNTNIIRSYIGTLTIDGSKVVNNTLLKQLQIFKCFE